MSQAAVAMSRSEATEARILDAAAEQFAKRGLTGTRVREIALAASVSPATLYIYFPSKTALYQAVLDRGLQPVAGVLDAIDRDRPNADLAGLIEDLLRHLAAHPSLSRLIYVEAISEGPFLAHLARTWIGPLLERMTEMVRNGPAADEWPDEELPLLTASILQVVFGPFALAALLHETSGTDPLAPEALRRQTRFLLGYFEHLFPQPNPGSAGARPTGG